MKDTLKNKTLTIKLKILNEYGYVPIPFLPIFFFSPNSWTPPQKKKTKKNNKQKQKKKQKKPHFFKSVICEPAPLKK